MSSTRYRKLVRFYHLKNIIAKNSIFSKSDTVPGYSKIDGIEEVIQAEYAAVGICRFEDVSWSGAIEQCRSLSEAGRKRKINQVKLEYIHLGKDLFESKKT